MTFKITIFKRDIRFMLLYPGTRILHEFDIPSITSSEDTLKTLADKRGLSILTQIREGAPRPIVRIMRKINDLVSRDQFPEEESFIKKMMRSFTTTNVECYHRHTALIIPLVSGIPMFGRDRITGNRGVSITTTFNRTGKEFLDLKDLIPIIGDSEALHHGHRIQLYRDKTDADGLWKLKYSASPDYNGNNLIVPVQLFTTNVEKQIGNNVDYQYRVKL